MFGRGESALAALARQLDVQVRLRRGEARPDLQAPVDLTATEYELLRVLSLDAGRVVTFETLLWRVRAKPESAGANLAPFLSAREYRARSAKPQPSTPNRGKDRVRASTRSAQTPSVGIGRSRSCP